MSHNEHPLQDEATPPFRARSRPRFMGSADGHTLAGWFGRCLLLLLLMAPLFAGSVALGRVLGRWLYHVLH